MVYQYGRWVRVIRIRLRGKMMVNREVGVVYQYGRWLRVMGVLLGC